MKGWSGAEGVGTLFFRSRFNLFLCFTILLRTDDSKILGPGSVNPLLHLICTKHGEVVETLNWR